MKKRRGISLVAISVTIIAMIIILTTIVISANYSMNNAKKVAFANELYNIQMAVDEYYENSGNVIPIVNSIDVDLSNVGTASSQFTSDQDSVVNNILFLDVLDLDKLQISNTQYGKNSMSGDVYAVSGTNKVYYVKGLEIGGKIYYTLTDELIQIVEKSNQTSSGKSGIIFEPNEKKWTNIGISVSVKASSGYSIVTNGVTATESKSVATTNEGYVVNNEKSGGNYIITVNYTKEGSAETFTSTYLVKKYDNVNPVINENNIEYENGYLKNISATDVDGSGIKVLKYSEGTIDAASAKQYFSSKGTVVSKGKFKPGNDKYYTIYAEDRAGNATIIPVEVDKNIKTKKNASNISGNTITGNTVMLNDSVEGNLLNYRIYGSSVQATNPTPGAPADVISLGETSKNLFDKNGGNIFNGYFTNAKIFATNSSFKIIYVKCKPNTTYTVSKMVSSRFAVAYTSEPPANDVTVKGSRSNYTGTSITITTDNTAEYLIAFVYNQSEDVNTDFETILSSIQIEQGSVATSYRPYNYVDIVSSGKNLLNNDDIFVGQSFTQNGITYEKTNEGILVNGSSNENFSHTDTVSFIGKVEVGKTYTISGSKNEVICYFYTVENGNTSWSSTQKITSDMTRIGVYLQVSPNTTVNNVLIKPQLEEGTTATSYESYQDPITTTIDLTGHEPLRKVGDVEDYIDFKNGNIVRNIGKLILNGSEVYTNRTSQGSFVNCLWFQTSINNSFINTNGNSSHFNIINNALGDYEHLRFITGNYFLGIIINKTRLETYDIVGFKSWLAQQYTAGTPVTVYYQLATPVEEKIDLPNITTFDGGTNLTVRDAVITNVGIKANYVANR